MNIHKRYGRISTMAALAALAATSEGGGQEVVTLRPEGPTRPASRTAADLERIRVAEAKRARKAAKRKAR